MYPASSTDPGSDLVDELLAESNDIAVARTVARGRAQHSLIDSSLRKPQRDRRKRAIDLYTRAKLSDE